ncbi:MAG: hypothetical protein M3O50_09260 [Myxococcota bacterium]|nr:hypothetical protein [Myxococcota bacterium]
MPTEPAEDRRVRVENNPVARSHAHREDLKIHVSLGPHHQVDARPVRDCDVGDRVLYGWIDRHLDRKRRANR